MMGLDSCTWFVGCRPRQRHGRPVEAQVRAADLHVDVETEENGADANRERRISRRGEADGCERGECDERAQHRARQPGSKGHAAGKAKVMPDRYSLNLR